MLFYRFPSKSNALLAKLINKKIIKVRRQILKNDIKLYQNFEQNGDGPVEIQLQDGFLVHFIGYTERCSILLKQGPMPDYGKFYKNIDVSHTHFWQQRLNKSINNIIILEDTDSIDICEFGIEVYIDNASPFVIEYINEEEWPDMIRITEHKEYFHCQKIPLPVNTMTSNKLYPLCTEEIRKYYKIPSEAITLLSCLKGKKIVSVKRQILKQDTGLKNFEEKGDGPVEIRLKNGFSFHIMNYIDRKNILIQEGPMPDCGDFYREFDVSHTTF